MKGDKDGKGKGGGGGGRGGRGGGRGGRGGRVRSLFSSILGGASDNSNLPPTEPREDGFLTAWDSNALFTHTTAEVDGDECLHDCDTCTVKLPRGFKIEEDDALYGEVNGWARHVLVATGKTDWVRDVADEKDSVMEAMDKHYDTITGGKLMLSASNIPVPDEHEHDGPYGRDRPTSVLLMPAFQFVDNVTPAHVPQLIQSVINVAPTNLTRMGPAPPSADSTADTPAANGATDAPATQQPFHLSATDLPAGLTLRACPHQYLILMCSQATRDARCGQSAPLLRKELERHLRPLGLFRDPGDERPGGVGIYYISHVGGHKYSANVMVYRRGTPARSGAEQINGSGQAEAAQCIWLARVKPEDCENLVRFTVLQGKVVKPASQLRGGFDREKGVVSW